MSRVVSGRRLDPRAVLALLLFSVALFVGLRLFLAPPRFTDLKVYRAEGLALRDGRDLYGPLPGVHGLTTYPPFAALIFVPASFVSVSVLKVFAVAWNLLLLGLVSWQSCRLVGVAGRSALLAGGVLAAVALWCEPVFITMSYGQINLLLLALVLWDFTRDPSSRLRGVGVGIAAGLKVTPGVLIIYLILTRRFRAAATAVGALALTMGLSASVDARATWRYWTDYLFDSHRVGRLENAVNQTVRGWLVRADHTRDTRPTELLLVLVVAVVGLAVAACAYRLLGDSWGLPAAAITGLLCSPISWSHHWVWCVPVVALLWFRARWWLVPTVAIFWSFAVWWIPHKNSLELHLSRLQIAVSGWYVVFGLGFLALVAVRTYRAHIARLRPA